MKLQDIIDAERQLNRTISGLSQIGIDEKTRADLNNATALLQEVRFYAVCLENISDGGKPGVLTGGSFEEVAAAERLTNFIRHSIFAKDAK